MASNVGVQHDARGVLAQTAGRSRDMSRLAARAASLLLMIAGGALLLGWFLASNAASGSPVPGPIIGPGSSLGIALVGLAVWLHTEDSAHAALLLARLFADTGVLFVGAITLLQSVPGAPPLGIDGLFVQFTNAANQPPILRVPAAVAALFAILGAVLLYLECRRMAAALRRADTAQRQAGAAASQDAIRHRVLFEQARDGMLVFDEDRNIREANASFISLLGTTPEEVTSLHPWDWDVNAPSREEFRAMWPAMPETSGRIDTQFRRKTGEIIDVDITYTPTVLDGERYLYCAYRDVTARKNAERNLLDSQERFRRALANIPDVVVIYDRDLRIRYVNNATRATTGMNAAELIGRRDSEVFPPEVCDVYLPTLREALESKLIRKLETELTLPRVGTRALQITCVPLLDRFGEVREVLGITHDFTDQKEAKSATRKSEAQYRELVEQAADGIFIRDPEGAFVLVNTRCCELLGYTEDELLRMNGADMFKEEETDLTATRRSMLALGKELRYERRVKRKDGSVFPAEVSVKTLASGNQQVIFHDISSRYGQERKIARLSRIHAVLSGINSAIIRNRNREDLFRETCRIAVEAGRFQMAWIGRKDPATGNIFMIAQTGLPIDSRNGESAIGSKVELTPDGPATFALQEERPVYDNDIADSLHLSKLRRIAIRAGAKAVITLPLTVEGSVFGLLVLYAPERNFFDDEELKLLKELAGDISYALEFISKDEKVDYLAYYDTLTGLPNRSLFFDTLKRQVAAAEREGQKVFLQLMDIDRFSMINETYGRDGGDRLMALIADRMKASTDGEDTIARIGPDSFAIATSGEWPTAETAHSLEKLNEHVFGEPFILDEEVLRVSATSGVALFPADGKDAHTLVSNAEAALRDAKNRSLRHRFYSPEMNEKAADSVRLENRLRLALKSDEIVMWYQPKIRVPDGALTGFEALMRWKDRQSGQTVQPSAFMPIMEQTGLILEAGRRALAVVAADCRGWSADSVTVKRIAVNVSLLQVREDNFVDSIVAAQRLIRQSGAELEIELTESVVMENLDTIVPKLQTLRELGVLIAVDDFGTGYSSLAYIARLPIHALKVDRSFVVGMTEDRNSLTIVKSIISLAHSLGLKVIAEGVETAEQAGLLEKLKCEELQGFYLSPPVAPADVPALANRFK